MANLVVTVTQESGLVMVGATVSATLTGHSSQGANAPNPSGNGTTDQNGQFILELPESPNGWLGDCWSYTGVIKVMAPGYATVNDNAFSTGCVTGDVDKSYTLAPSTSGAPGSGTPAVGLPNFDWGSAVPYILGAGVLIAVGVAVYFLWKHYNSPEAREERREKRNAAVGVVTSLGNSASRFRPLSIF